MLLYGYKTLINYVLYLLLLLYQYSLKIQLIHTVYKMMLKDCLLLIQCIYI
jgi:hypothetical protein